MKIEKFKMNLKKKNSQAFKKNPRELPYFMIYIYIFFLKTLITPADLAAPK